MEYGPVCINRLLGLFVYGASPRNSLLHKLHDLIPILPLLRFLLLFAQAGHTARQLLERLVPPDDRHLMHLLNHDLIILSWRLHLPRQSACVLLFVHFDRFNVPVIRLCRLLHIPFADLTIITVEREYLLLIFASFDWFCES